MDMRRGLPRISLATGVFLAMAASPAYATKGVYCDRVWVWGGNTGANYTISPGVWTFDGAEKARTFQGGDKIDVGANEKGEKIQCVFGWFNDFHYGPDSYTPVGGPKTTIVYWATWSKSNWPVNAGDELELKGYATTGGAPADVMVDADFSADPQNPVITVTVDGTQVYSGPESGFDPAAHGLAHVASHFVLFKGTDVPTVSTWGLAVLVLMLLAAGTVVVRRMRTATA